VNWKADQRIGQGATMGNDDVAYASFGGKRDKSKVKCYKCNQMVHYELECTTAEQKENFNEYLFKQILSFPSTRSFIDIDKIMHMQYNVYNLIDASTNELYWLSIQLKTQSIARFV
jgi:hypothetical protein